MADKIKLIIAVAIVIAALFVFYTFGEMSALYRTLIVFAAVILAGFIASKTEVGANTIAFVRSSIIEMKKVVWPSKKETTQTTLTVGVMVIIVGIILWSFDQLIGWGVRLLTGQG